MNDIAVLLATYNGQQYIREQLDSLFAQTNKEFRIVIHDDGSTDGTTAIISEYREKYPDRIEIIYGPSTGGAKSNFMFLLSKVKADYYFFCDQDDVWLPEKVERSLKELWEVEKLPDNKHVPAIVFTDMYVVDKYLNIINNSFIRYINRSPKNVAYTQILIDNPASGTTCCFNRALRDKAVSSEDINWDKVLMHDAWVMEIGAVFGKVRCIDEPLVYYRQTGFNEMGAVTESEADKISRNIDTASKGFFEAKKAFINEARDFAREINKLSDIPMEKRKILKEFVNIGSKPKLFRMRFYKVNNFTRAHHSFWMRLWV